jgi:hypothetical protein
MHGEVDPHWERRCTMVEIRGGARMTPWLQLEAKAIARGPVDALGYNRRRRRVR